MTPIVPLEVIAQETQNMAANITNALADILENAGDTITTLENGVNDIVSTVEGFLNDTGNVIASEFNEHYSNTVEVINDLGHDLIDLNVLSIELRAQRIRELGILVSQEMIDKFLTGCRAFDDLAETFSDRFGHYMDEMLNGCINGLSRLIDMMTNPLYSNSIWESIASIFYTA